MNYRKVYQQLCQKGIGRTIELGLFYEKHHIKPRSFGGNDSKNNITLLTLKEHYIAHLLLVAIYPNSPAMQTALWNMCHVTPKNSIGYTRYKPCSKMYELIRSDYIRVCSGVNHPRYGTTHSKESILKLSDAAKGKQPRLGAVLSEETKEKISKSKKGIRISEDIRKQISQSLRGGKCYKAKKVVSILTNEEFPSGRELSDYLGIPFSTIRTWLNTEGKAPIWFHYRRAEKVKVAYDLQQHYTNTKGD